MGEDDDDDGFFFVVGLKYAKIPVLLRLGVPSTISVVSSLSELVDEAWSETESEIGSEIGSGTESEVGSETVSEGGAETESMQSLAGSSVVGLLVDDDELDRMPDLFVASRLELTSIVSSPELLSKLILVLGWPS